MTPVVFVELTEVFIYHLLLAVSWANFERPELIVVIRWYENAITCVQSDGILLGVCEMLKFTHFWREEINWRSVNDLLAVLVVVLSIVIRALFNLLARVDFLSIDVRDQLKVSETFNDTHDLFSLLVVRFVKHNGTLIKLYTFQFRDIAIKFWNLNITKDVVQ